MGEAQELTASGTQVAPLLDAISSVVIAVDAAGRIVYWNSAAAQTFGVAAAAAVGTPIGQCGIQWDGEAVRVEMASCRGKGERQRVELKFTGPAGRDRIFGMTLSPTEIHGGPGLVLLGADITERIRLEGELRQAQKLESVGRLASGIAHEINTPIQFVGDNTRFLLEAFQDVEKLLGAYGQLRAAAEQGPVAPELLAEVRRAEEQTDLAYLKEEIPRAAGQTLEGVDRVANIVRAMKDFARQDAIAKSPADLNRALQTTLTVARSELKYVADVKTNLDPALPPVLCHEGRLKQVFLNLLVNAAHAIGDVVAKEGQPKGQIAVTTRREGEEVVIAIADTGAGIPPEIRDRIFDPFFTTKAVGRGSGQGLAIARAVVCEKHGGTITFATEVGKGTTFFVRLPINGPPEQGGPS